MTDSPDIPLELQRLRAPARGRSGNRRPRTDPPGTGLLLAVHRNDHPLRAHRQGAGPLHPPVGLETVTRPDPGRHGATPPLRRLRLLESGPPEARHARREPIAHAEDALQTWPSAIGRQSADQPEWGAGMPGVQRGEPEGLPGAAAPPEPLAPIPHRIRYVNQSSALASLLVHGSVKRHVDVSRNVMLLSVGVDEMCQ
jgi:hypothetical protein